jgi:hypothetical protein
MSELFFKIRGKLVRMLPLFVNDLFKRNAYFYFIKLLLKHIVLMFISTRLELKE